MSARTAPSSATSSASAWTALRQPLFRALWIAAVVSQVGSFATDVAQGWLMTTLDASPLTVALLTTAESVPFFLLSLPAGALADVVDRRRLLVAAQSAMVLVAAALAVLTGAGLMTPGLLLGLAAAMGVAVALNNPAWYAIPSEILPKEHLAGGVTLNGVGFNIARVLGPALGGLLVAAQGPAAVFALDAISTVGVIAVLLLWRRERAVTVLPAERLLGATKAGLRFARHSPALRKVLMHAFGFISCGCVVMALLPVLARETDGGPLAFGLLLGSLGSGAVAATSVLPRIRAKWSTDAIVAAGSWTFAAACAGMAFARDLRVLCPVFAAGGAAWMAVLSTLNVAAQRVSPGWVRARALAVYLLVFQAGIAGGSALWGFVASRQGLAAAYCAAATGMAFGSLVLLRAPLASDEELDLTPTRHWPEPKVVGAPDPESGPVVVEVEYRVDPARAGEFVAAARDLERIRRRDGAVEWWLLRDGDDPGLYVEIFAVETWAEHLRQHERVSAADRAVEDRVRTFLVSPERPRGRHLLAAQTEPPAAGGGPPA